MPPRHCSFRSIRRCLFAAVVLLAAFQVYAAQAATGGAAGSAASPVPSLPPIHVWPAGRMPGRGAQGQEHELPQRPDRVHRLTDVSDPTLTVYRARTDAASPAMIVCPGGGYSYVVYDKEGTDIAGWLNRAGLTALVLRYRVPNNREGAFQDLQRSLSLARAHAGEWGVDPHQLGVIGFSAGGNLAAKASNLFDRPSYAAVDAADQQSCRPDFAVLVYPAYLEEKGQLASDLHVTAAVPPTLIVHNEDDKMYVPGSKVYAAALEHAGVAHEFKLYATGGHGYGLRCELEARAWPEAALAWFHHGLDLK